LQRGLLGDCGAGSLEAVASGLVKCNLDVVAVQEVRWDNGGSQPADDNAFFLWK